MVIIPVKMVFVNPFRYLQGTSVTVLRGIMDFCVSTSTGVFLPHLVDHMVTVSTHPRPVIMSVNVTQDIMVLTAKVSMHVFSTHVFMAAHARMTPHLQMDIIVCAQLVIKERTVSCMTLAW